MGKQLAKYLSLLIGILVACSWLLAVPAQAEKAVKVEPASTDHLYTRIAVVSVSTLVSQAPQAKTASDALKQEYAEREAELDAEERAISDLQYQLKRAENLSDEERLQQERMIRSRKRAYRRDREDFRSDLLSAREEKVAKIQNDVFNAIEEVRRQNKIDVVLKESDFIAASSRIDITDLVMKYLMAKSQIDAENAQAVSVPAKQPIKE